jgi:hypothetical protein
LEFYSFEGTSVQLARPGNPASWIISLHSQNSVYMTSLAILGHTTICATGLTFYFSDGSSQTVGTNYDQTISILNFANPNGLSSVNTYAGSIIDILQICNTANTCVTAGNYGGRTLNYFSSISPSWNVTAFWGSYAYYSGVTCLQSFGIYYTLSLTTTSTTSTTQS